MIKNLKTLLFIVILTVVIKIFSSFIPTETHEFVFQISGILNSLFISIAIGCFLIINVIAIFISSYCTVVFRLSPVVMFLTLGIYYSKYLSKSSIIYELQ